MLALFASSREAGFDQGTKNDVQRGLSFLKFVINVKELSLKTENMLRAFIACTNAWHLVQSESVTRRAAI